MRTTLLFALGVLSACKGASTEPIDTDPVESSCVAELVAVTPTDGDVAVSTDTVVTMQFSSPPGSEWGIQFPNVDGSASIAGNGLSAIFVPDAALEEEASYTFTVSVCGTDTPVSFTTEASPVTVPEGTTYEMPFDELVWHEPSSAAAFAVFVDFESFLMQTTTVDADGTGFEALFTAGWPGGEAECPSVVTIVADYTTNPVFVSESGSMEIPVEGAPVPFTVSIDNLVFTGRFTEQGELSDVSFTGRIDTRPFDLLLGDGATCELATAAGDQCEACADGEPACLFVDVEVVEAYESLGPDITEFCAPEP